jgi:hypothetical protein
MGSGEGGRRRGGGGGEGGGGEGVGGEGGGDSSGGEGERGTRKGCLRAHAKTAQYLHQWGGFEPVPFAP